ncbi:MAG: response regulator [Pedosphaera sp.]|nr:response regulator [Pedosphaera sp.]
MILTNTFEVVVANSGSEALSLTSKDSYSTVIVDYRISGMDGTEFLSQLQLIDPLVSTILMTAIPSLEIASSGIRLGISEVDPENWTSG